MSGGPRLRTETVTNRHTGTRLVQERHETKEVDFSFILVPWVKSHNETPNLFNRYVTRILLSQTVSYVTCLWLILLLFTFSSNNKNDNNRTFLI